MVIRELNVEPLLAGRCLRHPSEPVVLICSRCGSFACATCADPSGRCADCVARASSWPPGTAVLLRDSWKHIANRWRAFGAVALFDFGLKLLTHECARRAGWLDSPWHVLGYRVDRFWASIDKIWAADWKMLVAGALLAPITAAVAVGALSIFADAERGAERPLSQAWVEGLPTFVPVLLFNLVANAFQAVSWTVCCVPFVLLALFTWAVEATMVMRRTGFFRGVALGVRISARAWRPLLPIVGLAIGTLVVPALVIGFATKAHLLHLTPAEEYAVLLGPLVLVAMLSYGTAAILVARAPGDWK